jgi:hypothetical protein
VPSEGATAEAGPTCRGILVVYALGEGECDRRHDCQVYELRWTDHEAYLAAHQLRILPDDWLAPVY